LAEAVFARCLSARQAERVRAAQELPGPGSHPPPDRAPFLAALHDALHMAKLGCYAQGFALLAAGGAEFGWPLDLAEIARVWRGGCIIRARLLEDVRAAFAADPSLPNLLLAPQFRDTLQAAQAPWRAVMAAAVQRGVPTPALSAALAYYDGARTARSGANLIQAQRDLFGAHTYQRCDRPGTFHTDWTA
jgi:6-phosphogluconate dehydrogenase